MGPPILPAGGAYYWDELHYPGDYGYYWSSTNVYQLDFSLSWHNHSVESNAKGYNYTVRAVLAE